MNDVLMWWLALVLTALVAWYLGRQTSLRRSGMQMSRVSKTWFRGLNYLLNEEPDKAIETFLQIAKHDPDSIEMQLALGHLFRQRGELERAIRLHRDLISRTDLAQEHKISAMLELGEDYMRAGLLDRAEVLFTDLTRADPTMDKAVRHLLAIYQVERDWAKAIEYARRLENLCSESFAALIAQFHCELAEQALAAGDHVAAKRALEQATEADPNSLRAGMLAARMATERSDWAAAVRHYERIARQCPAFLSEVLPFLLPVYAKLEDRARARAFLSEMLERHAGIASLLALLDMLESEEGDAAARALLARYLPDFPSPRAQAALLHRTLVRGRAADPEMLALLAACSRDLLARAPAYRCKYCGFSAKTHHWQCPSCRNWDSVMPSEDAVIGR